MKVVAIIQARMGSERLPGKVLLSVGGQPMIALEINRLRSARSLDEIVVATTDRAIDDPIEGLCKEMGVECFRGSENDVLDRYYQTARRYHGEGIVRITGDCPFVDPHVVDQVVQVFRDKQPSCEYASNIFPVRTFPRGLDTEVIRFDALEQAWLEASDPASREHVTPHIYRNPSRFNIVSFTNEADFSSMRWTVDTDEDFRFVSIVCEHLSNDRFSWKEVVALLACHPSWQKINEQVRQKAL